MRRILMLFSVAITLAVVAAPTKSMLGAQRSVGGSKLPYDAEVEWIGSSGVSSFIDFSDSGLFNDLSKSASDTLEISAIGKMLPRNGWDIFVIIMADWYLFQMSVYPEFRYNYGNNRDGALIANDFHEYKATYGSSGGKSTASVDGVLLLESNTILSFNKLQRFSLFARPDGSDYLRQQGNLICSLSILKNDECLMDLIPVRFTNEHGVSEGAMYDRVSGQLFRNQGTGAFFIGPDKK